MQVLEKNKAAWDADLKVKLDDSALFLKEIEANSSTALETLASDAESVTEAAWSGEPVARVP